MTAQGSTEVDAKQEDIDNAAARLPVTHLVLCVHGIGQNLTAANIAGPRLHPPPHVKPLQRNSCWRTSLSTIGEDQGASITMMPCNGRRDVRVADSISLLSRVGQTSAESWPLDQ